MVDRSIVVVASFANLVVPAFQPIASGDGQLFGYEALMRTATSATCAPVGAIRHWEESGQISYADLGMIGKISRLCQDYFWRPRLTVNVSPVTIAAIGGELLRQICALAANVGELVVELTETAPIRDTREVLWFVQACRSSGVRVALDDCQPGHLYWDPEFVKAVRPDLLKLDGQVFLHSFDSGDCGALDYIVRLAREVGARTIFEHIGCSRSARWAFDHGADLAQGYLVGRPIGSEQMFRFDTPAQRLRRAAGVAKARRALHGV